MTMTQADWNALYEAGQHGGQAYLEQQAAQINAYLQAMAGNSNNATLLQDIPDAGGGGNPAVPGTSGQFTVGQDAINQVEQEYPNLAWMLTIPDLGPLIVQWAQEGLDPTSAEAQFESTTWYRTHSQSVQKWITEVDTDPAQATADLQAQESAMNATLAQLGLKATPQQIQLLSQQSLAMGWTDQQIKDNIAANTVANSDGTFSFKYGGSTSQESSSTGTLAVSMDSIQAEAGKYLVPISNQTAQGFATAIAQGTMDPSGVDAYLQAQAESLYPSIAGAIKSGITPQDYVSPYQEVAAQLLGVDPKSIDFTQQKYARALSQPGQGGTPVAMSLYAWQQMLMQDPQYGYMNSVNARDRASSIAQGIGEMFGKVASGPAGSTAFQAAGAPTISGVPIT